VNDAFNTATIAGQYGLESAPDVLAFPGAVYEHVYNTVVFAGDPSQVPVSARETIGGKFVRLAAEWEAATRTWSSLQAVFEHRAYREIIDMGKDVVPLLLADLQQQPRHWFFALRAITGESPIPEEVAGNLRGMANAWIDWGKKNNLI